MPSRLHPARVPLDLGLFPVALLLPVLLIPIGYCLGWKRVAARSVLGLSGCCVLVVLLYPAVFFLSDALGILGYAIGKFALFVCLPLAAVVYLEGREVRAALANLGLQRLNVRKSLLLGMLAAVVMIAVTVLVTSAQPIDLFIDAVLFVEAFTEEFLFRGVLLLYLATKTTPWVAYATSILGFIAVHPQNFESWFLVSTVLQAVLLAVVAARTQNLAGPWLAHGLTRSVPQAIRVLLAA